VFPKINTSLVFLAASPVVFPNFTAGNACFVYVLTGLTTVQNGFWELLLNTIQALVESRTVLCRSPVVFLWLLHHLCSRVLWSSDRASTVRRVELRVSRGFSAPHVATILDDPEDLEAFSRSPAFEQVLHTIGDCPIARSTRFRNLTWLCPGSWFKSRASALPLAGTLGYGIRLWSWT
jgi:hypothetical protein